ncbi:MAG TPA: ABC transporter ATP-binding protein [Armatimonadota bacterium]|nr:ABC transporter ATP-binding protein [Armatimonadota bacterium]
MPRSLLPIKSEHLEDIRTLRRLLRTLWETCRCEILVVGSVGLFAGMLPALQLAALRRLIDQVLLLVTGGSAYVTLAPWVLLFLCATFAEDLLQWVERWINDTINDLVKARLHERLLKHAVQIPLRLLEQPLCCDRLRRAENGVDEQLMFTVNSLLDIAPEFAAAVGMVAYVGTGSILFPALLLLGTLPAMAAHSRVQKRLYELDQAQTSQSRDVQYLEELLRGRDSAPEIRLFGLGEFLIRRRQSLYRAVRSERLAIDRQRADLQALTGTIRVVTFIAVAGIVALFAEWGRFSVGQYATYVGATEIYQVTVLRLLLRTAFVRGNLAYFEDIESFLKLEAAQPAAKPPTTGPEEQVTRGQPAPAVELQNVSFSYPGSERAALLDVSLSIAQGETIALVGENRSGKTTLAKIILGLYDPISGRVSINGWAMRAETGHESLAMAALFQQYARYQTSVRANIGFGDIDRLEDLPAIRESARESGADEFIDHLPRRYETLMGKGLYDEGCDLSTGQWQRLATARTYFRGAQLAVLDEPTAALDPEAEVEMYRQFSRICQARSVLLISHRLGCAQLAHRIVVLEKGQVVEQGTHEQLLKRRGLYHRMFEVQAQWYR